MRYLLLVAALISALPVARAENEALTTNTVTVNKTNTLAIPMPASWSLIHTNMHLRGNPPSIELHSPSNAVAIRLTIYWDGFARGTNSPATADFEKIVSNVVVRQYLPIAVEKTFTMESLHGAAVTGTFARFTDAGWTPVVKDEYHNLATGMFRCGNLWGNFDLLTNDKDGPTFKQGLTVLQSLHRKP